MNTKMDSFTSAFRFQWEKFKIGCDAVEEIGGWDLDTLGEMDVYYENDLMSLILRLIVSDGVVSDDEVRYMNDNFGYAHSVSTLKAIYRDAWENFDEDFLENFQNNLNFIEAFESKLAEAYKKLVVLICQIIAASDRKLSEAEKEDMEAILEICKQ